MYQLLLNPLVLSINVEDMQCDGAIPPGIQTTGFPTTDFQLKESKQDTAAYSRKESPKIGDRVLIGLRCFCLVPQIIPDINSGGR